jgi:hypothetical protein
MDFDAVSCLPKALKRDGPMSVIVQMTYIVVAQKLKCLEDLGFKQIIQRNSIPAANTDSMHFFVQLLSTQ